MSKSINRKIAVAAITLLAPACAAAAPFWGATQSRPPETAPETLSPGEFVWNPAAADTGPVLVVVSLREQRAYVHRNGVEIGVTTISSGKPGHDTPTGVFVILQKDKDHRSSKYNSAPMPYTQRLTWDGVALHAGGLPGHPSSHGCVHLPSKFSEELFAVSPMGMTVVVANEPTSPARVVHPPAFAPVDADTGSPVTASQLRDDQEFRLEPERARSGPVSVLMSIADKRIIVLRNGIEIGRSRITVTDPSVPIGTHTFVLQDGGATRIIDGIEDPRTMPWIAVQTPGHSDDAGRPMRPEAIASISMPPRFLRAVSPILAPGTTLFVTEAPILASSRHSDFTVLTNDAPGSAGRRGPCALPRRGASVHHRIRGAKTQHSHRAPEEPGEHAAMKPLHATLVCLALAYLPACSSDTPPPVKTAAGEASGGPPPLAEADLVATLRAATGTDPQDARYFAASVDLDGDGTAEKIVYVAGPVICGTGGCPLFVLAPGIDGYRLVSRLTVVRLPVRLSPRSSHGWRNLVVRIGGGGMATADVELAFDGATYPPNPTVEPAGSVPDTDKTEVLIPEFGSYKEGKSMTAQDASGAADYGDPVAPVVGRVFGAEVHARDAEELRYVILRALTTRFAAQEGVAVSLAERDAYLARARDALSEDPATATSLGKDTPEDAAARAQIADAFIRQWKLNRTLFQRYGGRIIFQQGGPEPLDAYRKFLEERQAAGDFVIADEALSAAFWRYYRDDSLHSFFESGSREEAAAFATPPWEARRDGTASSR